MDLIDRLGSYSPKHKILIGFILVAGYAGVSAIAPFPASFAVLMLGFVPLILISLMCPWQVGTLMGVIIPIINTTIAFLRADPLFTLDRRIEGIIFGGIIGAVVAMTRDQWVKLKRTETLMEEGIRAKTQALQRQNDYLMALHETTLALINHLELHDLFGTILTRACQLSETEHGFIDLVSADKAGIRQEYGLGDFVHLNGVITSKGEGLTGQVWETGKFMQVDDYPTWNGHIPAYKTGVHAIIGLPLRAGSEIIGVLGLAYAEKGRLFSAEQIRQLDQFAHLASLAYENARLYQTAQDQLRLREQVETEIRKLNDELEKRVLERTVQLEYANRELQSFSYSISHDLRPPLRAIDGYSRIVIEDYSENMPPEGLDLLHKVRKNAQKMDRLINDILGFTRLGRHKLRRVRVETRTELMQAYRKAAEEFPHAEKIKLTIGELPEFIHADPDLLNIIFTNLLSNSIKFSSGSAAPEVQVGCATMHDRPTFYVKDNGIGFDMKYAQKIFSVFERLHTDNEFEGTGVGLAIVQRAIQIHEGRIWVNSEPGKGAEFYFTLGEI